MDERRADVVQPAQRVERDVAGVADQHEPAELRGDAVVAAGLALAADAVVDDQVPAVDVDLEPVAVRDADAVAGGLGSLSLHTKASFRVPCPRAVPAVAGAKLLTGGFRTFWSASANGILSVIAKRLQNSFVNECDESPSNARAVHD